MKPASKILLSAALFLLLVIAAVVVLHQPAVDDRVQIGNQLEAARAAGERHDVGGIMRIVSEKYHDPNVPSPIQLRFLLNKVQGNEAVIVTQSLPVITVNGDTATSTSRLRVVAATGSSVVYDHDVTIQWVREDSTRLWVIPTKVWRAVSADYGSFSLLGD
jgi:hypothetical protein